VRICTNHLILKQHETTQTAEYKQFQETVQAFIQMLSGLGASVAASCTEGSSQSIVVSQTESRRKKRKM